MKQTSSPVCDGNVICSEIDLANFDADAFPRASSCSYYEVSELQSDLK